jgi:hypothetical protein
MPYTHVQFIAYEIQTLEPFYAANQTMKRIDILQRAKHLAKVIDSTLSDQAVDTSETTLKIFAAPEFFWRYPKGKDTGEDHFGWSDVEAAVGDLKQRCATMKSLKNALIIPGTFVYQETVSGEWVGAPEKPFLFNSLYLFTNDGRLSHTINKLFFAEIDQLEPDQSFEKQGGTKWAKYLSTHSLGTVEAGFDPIQIDNLTIGFEICKDHIEQRLKKSLQKAKPPVQIDVQVLVACGAPPTTSALIAKSNGAFLRCDGGATVPNSTDAQPESEADRIDWPGKGLRKLATVPPLVSKKELSLLPPDQLKGKKGTYSIYTAQEIPVT